MKIANSQVCVSYPKQTAFSTGLLA